MAHTISEQEQRNNASEERTLVYACTCGFTTPDAKELRTHIWVSSRDEGKGTHRSAGKMDVATGEIVVPPARELRKMGRQQAPKDIPPRKPENLDQVQQIQFTPTMLRCNFTPIMRAAYEAAVREFNWRPDMGFEDFLDTCLAFFFKDRGITLAGYIIEDKGGTRWQ